MYDENSERIFHLQGLKFLKFSHKKVKFMFEPSKLVTFVSKRVVFFCSLKYWEKYECWSVKRDSFPANLKWKIYQTFYDDIYYTVDDELLLSAIQKIYNHLERWSNEEEKFRLEKMTVSVRNVYLGCLHFCCPL